MLTGAILNLPDKSRCVMWNPADEVALFAAPAMAWAKPPQPSEVAPQAFDEDLTLLYRRRVTQPYSIIGHVVGEG